MSGSNLLNWGMFEPDPRNALNAPAPTQADAWESNRATMADRWAGLQDPETFRDLPMQIALGFSAGTLGSEGAAAGMGLDAAAMKVLREMSPGFRAYHGSPHSFDAFDSAKIGTGEGAQAYGHGLYVADSEGVARSYRDSLSPAGVVVTRNGQPVGPLANAHIVNDPQYVAAYNALMPDPGVPGWIKSGIMRDIHGLGDTGQNIDLDTARQASIARMTKEMAQFSPGHQQRAVASINQAYDSIGGDVQFRRPGQMYEVQVNADPAHFLDWDKPRDQQPPNVQAFAQQQYPRAWENAADGSSLYQHMVKQAQSEYPGATNAHAIIADEMAKAGIPGIRYLDGGSRADGSGTSNHVIFDANTLSILRKYGIGGLIAGGAAAGSSQQ